MRVRGAGWLLFLLQLLSCAPQDGGCGSRVALVRSDVGNLMAALPYSSKWSTRSFRARHDVLGAGGDDATLNHLSPLRLRGGQKDRTVPVDDDITPGNLQAALDQLEVRILTQDRLTWLNARRGLEDQDPHGPTRNSSEMQLKQHPDTNRNCKGAVC